MSFSGSMKKGSAISMNFGKQVGFDFIFILNVHKISVQKSLD